MSNSTADVIATEGESSSQEPSKPKRYGLAVLEELGLVNVYHSSRDVKFLYAQRFVRLFAYGASTLILASYLSALGHSDERIGLFMTLTLAGDVVISFLLTLFADATGRKAILGLGSLLMTASGIVFGLFGNYWVLLAAAIFGVISPSGNEIGPFRAVEESTIAHIVVKEHLGDIFAWYALTGSAGTACGMMFCGWFIHALQSSRKMTYIDACRYVFFVYAGIGILKFIFTLALSKKVELWEDDKPKPKPGDSETEPLLQGARSDAEPPPPPPKKPSVFSFDKHLQILMWQLCLLFALDSFASGLAPLSWVTYFFKQKFKLQEGKLGSIFFITSIIQALSTICAASIAKRIGNVKTMVFTHLPSAICLALIPIPSALWLALVFLIGRACTQSMDVAPRSAFLANALPRDKRTAMMGFINVVKTCSQSIGPYVTGMLAGRNLFWVSFVAAGSLKATYDIGMLLTFAGRDSSKPKTTTPQNQDQEQQNTT